MNWVKTSLDSSGKNLGPVTVNCPSATELLADLESRLAAGNGFSVATLNLDHVVKLQNSTDFRDAYRRHSHITADGNPIVWLSRLAGQRVCLVRGSELVDPVASIAATLEVPVALFGTSAASLEEAERVLSLRYPGFRVVARIAPPLGFDPVGTAADTAIAGLARSGARLVFLALGAPKQEIFASRAQKHLPNTGFLSIGAGIDFISGAQSRAPKLVQIFAGEWLWRLASDPIRLARRYSACIAILPSLTWVALRSRLES